MWHRGYGPVQSARAMTHQRRPAATSKRPSSSVTHSGPPAEQGVHFLSARAPMSWPLSLWAITRLCDGFTTSTWGTQGGTHTHTHMRINADSEWERLSGRRGERERESKIWLRPGGGATPCRTMNVGFWRGLFWVKTNMNRGAQRYTDKQYILNTNDGRKRHMWRVGLGGRGGWVTLRGHEPMMMRPLEWSEVYVT